MAKEKPVDAATGPGAFPPSEEPPAPSTIASQAATAVSEGLIGDAASTATDLSEAAPNENEGESK
jgi:hypothetical protein